MFQTSENQGMVTDDKVAIFGDSFIHNFLSDIQANQGFTGFSVEITDLQACVVVTLLPLQRCNLGDAVQNVFYKHKFKIEAQN